MKHKRIIKYLLLLLCSAFAIAGCDVHEFPDIPENRTFQVNVNYHLEFTNFTEWEHLYNDDNVYEVGLGNKYQNIHDQGIVRYTIRAYPKSEKQRTMQDYVKEFVFTRDISDGYDCDFTLDLAPGNYTIMVWSDFIRYDGDSYFYNADSFSEITLQGKHQGNTDYRDAFRGVADVVLPADIIDHRDIILDVHMQRPLAKYEFVTTDLTEFISKEQTRAEERSWAQGETRSVDNTAPDTRVNIEDYKAVFYYVGFMPNVYSMFTDKPVDSATGVLFESKLNSLSETEASVGFDYVFVNGTESAVTVQIGIYDNEGTQLSMTEPINVPLQRSHHTIMRGMFMMSKASGGVSLNPDFDGDYNLVFP